ncbi:MAG: 4'-phosphopantetheinyl transferase superfamily protein [Pseudomonadota bacterium]
MKQIETPQKPTLQPDEIQLWFTFPEEIQNLELLSAYEKLMNQEERAQQQRLHFAKHRHQYLITRALVRSTLSRYTNIEPQQWRFWKNDYGRPEIISTANTPPLRFNLSHTDGLIICGVVLKQDIGVDVENLERKGAMLEIAQRFFSPKEIKDLYSLPAQQRRERFFDYWTLKESYIKARSMGLSLPLEQFSFHISEHQPIQITFAPQMHDEPSQWQFWLLKPTQHHKATVSICRPANRHYRLTMKKVVPLMKEQTFSCTILNQTENAHTP